MAPARTAARTSNFSSWQLQGRSNVERFLTIVGASARAAACSAVRAGFVVHAADLFADADLCRIAEATRVRDYPHGLAAVLAGPQTGGWMYTGALENYPKLVDEWSRLRRLWGNAGDVLRGVRQPRELADALGRAGLPCPAVTFDGGPLPRDGTWLRKAFRSAGGARVY